MATFYTNKLIILSVFFIQSLSFSFGFNTEWEFKQFQNIGSQQYFQTNKLFVSIEEVIKDAENVTKSFITREMIPGVAIGLSIKGKTVWTEGFGHIDIENNVTTDKNSVWRLASISKPLTSALVAQLIEKGLLDLNKTVSDYIPEALYPKKTFNEQPVNITLRECLSHMAGLHMTRLEDFNHIVKAQNVSQTIPPLKSEKLLFKPGTEFSYSNYGYQMVGAIIESVVKDTYPNAMRKMLLNLGMNNTFAEPHEQIIKHRPRYYRLTPEPIVNLENADLFDDLFSYEGWWPSGGMVSTVEDLLKFGYEMLSAYKGNNKKFLSQSTVKEFWRPETIGIKKDQNFGTNEYAKGWFVQHIPQTVDYPYKTLFWHSGGLLGTSTILLVFPDADIVGVAFANRGSVIGLDQLVMYVAKNLKDFIPVQ